MTYFRQNDNPDGVRNAEETLRLIATLPAPEGLADRVQARLSAAPRQPFLINLAGLNGWMRSPMLRGCAAAAIVLAVAGGGWGIYSRVQPASSAKITEAPARVGPNGGFSNAGAIRTPDTLNGPVLAHPTIPAQQNVIAPMDLPKGQTVTPKPQQASPKKKSAAPPVR
jgi:hypothetical protein